MNKQPAMTVLLMAVAMLVAACSGSSDSSGESSTSTQPTTSSDSTNTTDTPAAADDPDDQDESDDGVVEIPDELKDQAADALNVSKDSLQFNNPVLFASSSCFLQTAWSNDSTAFGAQFAVLDTGDVVARSESSVSTVLESCFFGAGNDITADEWAELVVSVDNTPLLVRVMTEDISFEAQNVGATWFAPVIETDGGASTLRFLAFGLDFADVYDVTATRGADGTFTSQYEALRAGG